MADDDTDEEFETDDIAEDFDDAPEEIDDDLSGDTAEVEDEAFAGDEDVLVVEDEPAPVPAPKAKAKGKGKGTRRSGEDDEDEEDDEEADPDDVEADLDTILKDRIAAQPDEDEGDDEDETPEPDERGDGTGRIQPKRPGEFVCQSCFLVKHPSQLADADNMLCADCV